MTIYFLARYVACRLTFLASAPDASEVSLRKKLPVSSKFDSTDRIIQL